MNRPLLKPALQAAIGLSLLFLLVYGGSNHLTALRGDVGSLAFAWEARIPFMPWMIVPYMSLDLFFIAAPFLCRDRDELGTLTRRIAFPIIAAGLVFLTLPLRCDHPRPPLAGWTGAVFSALRGFDLPYNQLPSLHIVL